MAIRGGATHRGYSVVVFLILASLDNVAIGLAPPLYGSIGADLGVGEGAIALVTTLSFLLSAIAAVGWAYAGDRRDRKPVLMAGTLLWAAGTGGTALAGGYGTFVLTQVVAAVGLGAVASVGFSVVSDLISPRRRPPPRPPGGRHRPRRTRRAVARGPAGRTGQVRSGGRPRCARRHRRG